MVGLAVPSLIVLVLALVATAVASSNEPSGPAQSAPPGYQTQNDGHFSYFVPKSWSNNPEFTDAAGDVETSGPSGFVGENIAYRPDPPTLGEAQPASLRSFGVPSPQPYSLTGGHAIAVPGAPTSYQYTVTRPGGFHAVAVDSWDPTDGVELWLLTEGPPAVTTQLISSLRAR